MDIDSALTRYLSNPQVSDWLFSTHSIDTITSEALDSSVVYAIGWGVCAPGAARSMNIEDMLIISGHTSTFVLGYIWGLSQPHIFARTPLMLEKVPVSRRFAVDISAREALEFMEFISFQDGKVVVMFRQFLHTHDLSLPVVACARLHAASKIEGTLGSILMRADVFEAASCPNCGQVGRSCRCSFDSYAPNTAVRRSTYTWNQFASSFMGKARVGTIKLKMTAVLPNVGEMRIMDDEIPVVNVLQRGDTPYMRLLKRKAVHGLGVHVVMPRTDAMVLAQAAENDFIDLHNSYVSRKRIRDHQEGQDQSLVDPSISLIDATHQQVYPALDLDFAHANKSLDAAFLAPVNQNTTSDSIESVDDVFSIFPSFFSTATSPHHPTSKRGKQEPYQDAAPNIAELEKKPSSSPVRDDRVPDDIVDMLGGFSKAENAIAPPTPMTTQNLLMMGVPNLITSSTLGVKVGEGGERGYEENVGQTPEDILNDIELILSPPGSQTGTTVASVSDELVEPLQLLSGSFGRNAVGESWSGAMSSGLGNEKATSTSLTGANELPMQTAREQQQQRQGKGMRKELVDKANPIEGGGAKRAKATLKRSKRDGGAAISGNAGITGENSGKDGEKKHGCTMCVSRFKMRGDLLRHIKIVHEGKKKYTCGTCGKSFGHSGHLNRHISSVHLQQRRFKCQFCGFQFFQASHLQSHIGHIHGAKKAFACKVCGYRASSQGGLKAHAKDVHAEGYKEAECSVKG